jgi:SAM-dependent methyltransferase
MGQTLIAARLPTDVEAYGVDYDREAIEAGRALASPNIKLLCSGGEKLPFADEYFDFVFSRVAVPYMDMNKALREIARVLKPGGDLWLSLHPASMVFSRAKDSLRGDNLKDLVFCGYVLLNGVLLNWFGTQISIRGSQETFQTVGGMNRAMKRAGLTCMPVQHATQLIVQGQKSLRGQR